MTVRELIKQLITVDTLDEEIYVATADNDGEEISHIEMCSYATFIIYKKEGE